MSGSVFDALTDPTTSALMGLAQGFGQASMPTRMPTPLAAVFGQGIGGLQQGLATGQALKRSDIQNQQARIGLDWYRNMTNPQQGQGGAPFGAPSMTQNTNGQYMVSPQTLASLSTMLAGTGKDPTGPLKLLESYATIGRAMGQNGNVISIPGATGAIGDEAAARAAGTKRAEAPYVPPQTYDMPVLDKNGQPVLDQNNQPTFRKQLMSPPQANTAVSGGVGATAPTDPRTAAVNAMNSIPDPKLRAMAANAIFKNGLPVEAVAPFIAGIHHESGWDQNVKNGTSGEIGLGQVMPPTGKMLGYTPEQLKDPQTNLDASVRYFGQKWLESKGNVAGTYAGYNTGSISGTPTSGYLDDTMPRLAKYGYPGVQAPQAAPVQVAGPGVPTGAPLQPGGPPVARDSSGLPVAATDVNAPVQMPPVTPQSAPMMGVAGPPVLTPQQTAQLEIDKARQMPIDISPGMTRVQNPAAAAQGSPAGTGGGADTKLAVPGVQGGAIESPYGPRGEIEPRQKILTELQTKANEARYEIQQATLLKQKMHELGSTGPATPFLANLSRYAEQVGVSPETLKEYKMPPGTTETEAAALANSLMMEVAKANFPNRITNADLQVAKTVKPNPAMPIAAADFLIDNTIVPHAQRDVDRYQTIVPLTMPKLPNGEPNPHYDRELRGIYGALDKFDTSRPPTSYTPALQEKPAAPKYDPAAVRAEMIRRGLLKE